TCNHPPSESFNSLYPPRTARRWPSGEGISRDCLRSSGISTWARQWSLSVAFASGESPSNENATKAESHNLICLIRGNGNLQFIRHWLFRIRVIVKPLTRLPSIPPRHHHPFQQRRRSEPPLFEFAIHHMSNVVSSIEPDKIQQSKRAHRIPAPQLHLLINV